MKFRIILSIAICFIFSAAFSQRTAKGKVYDAVTNNPLQGATISFSGKGGTITDKDGSFTVDCSRSNKITVSYVGYETYFYTIQNCDAEIRIALTPSVDYMDRVEITATSNENKSILYQPSSITKLTPVELKRNTGLFLDDAINSNVPGVSMNRRAVSSGQQFNIRGYGNGTRGTRGVSSNFDGQGYKVYLNGIPVTDAEGITTMDDIDFGSIGNVEVTKGPAGTLYGLAISGAVNLSSIKPENGKRSISQEVLLGNYGLQRFTTTFQMGGERSSLLVNYGHQKSDGFTIHNASHKDFVNMVGNFQPNTKQNINAYFGYSNSYDQRSGELTLTQYQTEDYTGNIDYIKRDGHSNVYTARAGFGHTYIFNNYISNTTAVFATGFNSNASSAGGWTDKASINLGLRSTFDTKFNLKNNIKLSGITGVETQRQNATTIGYGMVKDPRDTASTWVYGNPYYWIIGASNSNVYTATATTSVFTEWTLTLPKDISITAGIGMSNMKIGLDDRFYNSAQPNKVRQFDTTYKNMFSPHIAVNKVFNSHISAYVSYSQGYKSPVSSYFYIPSIGTTFNGALNRNLKPESGTQFEIGTKGELFGKKLNFQVALFNTVFSNKFTTVAVPNPGNTVTLYSYIVNGGKQEHNGIEALVKYSVYQSQKGFFKSIVPFANITYSDFKYKNYTYQTVGKTVTLPQKDSAFTTDYSNHAVAGIAKIVGNFGVDVATKVGLYMNVTYMYKDGFPITSDGLNKTTSYSLLNAKIGFARSLGRHFDIDASFGASNITNTKYPIMVFINQLPDAYIAAPRNANCFGSLKLKYNF